MFHGKNIPGRKPSTRENSVNSVDKFGKAQEALGRVVTNTLQESRQTPEKVSFPEYVGNSLVYLAAVRGEVKRAQQNRFKPRS
jgi:hypothetical protein